MPVSSGRPADDVSHPVQQLSRQMSQSRGIVDQETQDTTGQDRTWHDQTPSPILIPDPDAGRAGLQE